MSYNFKYEKVLKVCFTKLKNLYHCYKALSQYTQKQCRFRFINFLCLINYIIFEELSNLLKLKIMNELKVRELTKKAEQYLERVIEVEILDQEHFGKKKKITGLFTEIKSLLISEGKVNNILPLGKLTDLVDSSKYEPVPLSEIVRKFEMLDKKK